MLDESQELIIPKNLRTLQLGTIWGCLPWSIESPKIEKHLFNIDAPTAIICSKNLGPGDTGLVASCRLSDLQATQKEEE